MTDRQIPHDHFCPGCEHHWPCLNSHCTDLFSQWCRRWCEKPPKELQLPGLLESVGHEVHHAEQALRREGEVALADTASTLRENILKRVAQLVDAVKSQL